MTSDDSGAEMTSALEDERLSFFLQNRDLILGALASHATERGRPSRRRCVHSRTAD